MKRRKKEKSGFEMEGEMKKLRVKREREEN